MRDDVIEHLAAVNPFTDEIVVVGVYMHGEHAANVRVVKKKLYGGLPDGSHLFGQVFLLSLLYLRGSGLVSVNVGLAC